MKKMLMIMAMGAMAVTACSHDSKKSNNCFVNDFKAGCLDGKYITCEVDEPGDATGTLLESDRVDINGILYACNDRDELEADLRCANGIFAENQSNLIYTTDKIWKCVGNEIVDVSDSICFVNDFNEGCQNGKYVTCEVDKPGDENGTRLESDRIEINGLSYMCNGQNELEAVLSCVNGIFAENQRELIYTTDKILKCVGNEIMDVTDLYRSFCLDNARIYFDMGTETYRMQDCASENKVCEEMVKEDIVSAMCIEAGNVENGCANETAYGHCEGDTLVICSNNDQAKGKTLHIDCAAQGGRSCMLIEDGSYGYDCALTCGEEVGQMVTDFGFCDSSNHLHYCTQSGRNSEIDCESYSCGFDGMIYDCIEPLPE